mmetsp:Transcript_23815/g.74455  ORF Transcript_23815/g.74455 Transcript_23815/m.74455 type:complete len:233 (-) Transcript_23815:1570-2268(-)
MIFCWYWLSRPPICPWCFSSACLSFSSYSISCSFFSCRSSSNLVLSLSSSWVNFSVMSLIFSLRLRSLSRSWYSFCIVSSFTCVSSSAMRARRSSRSDLVTSTSSAKTSASFSRLPAARLSLSRMSNTKRQPSSETQKSSMSSYETRMHVTGPAWHWYSAGGVPSRGNLYERTVPFSEAAKSVRPAEGRAICVSTHPVSKSLVTWASTNSLSFRSLPTAKMLWPSGVEITEV